MGDFREYQEDRDAYDGPSYGSIEWELDQYNKHYPKVPTIDPDVWVTRDGRELPIAEMSNDHLRNALRFLARRCVRLHTGLLHHYKLRFESDFEDDSAGYRDRDPYDIGDTPVGAPGPEDR